MKKMKAKVLFSVLALVLVLSGVFGGLAQAASDTQIHVGGIRTGYLTAPGSYPIQVQVAAHDAVHRPVQGVTVLVEWKVPGKGPVLQKALTDATGWARLEYVATTPGVYGVCVTQLAKAGLFYNAKLNEQTCAFVSIPGVTPGTGN